MEHEKFSPEGRAFLQLVIISHFSVDAHDGSSAQNHSRPSKWLLRWEETRIHQYSPILPQLVYALHPKPPLVPSFCLSNLNIQYIFGRTLKPTRFTSNLWAVAQHELVKTKVPSNLCRSLYVTTWTSVYSHIAGRCLGILRIVACDPFSFQYAVIPRPQPHPHQCVRLILGRCLAKVMALQQLYCNVWWSRLLCSCRFTWKYVNRQGFVALVCEE